jgi:hypothetical protein
MRSFLYKASVLLAVAWAMVLVPGPVGALSYDMKNGAVVIATVLYLGKLLYDTLFYDHYVP